MLSFAGSLRVFLAVEPCDMHKGFEGLHGLVGERLREVVRGGTLFVFTNKRHTRLKVLFFDGTGLWLVTKRLEEGIFAWPKIEEIGSAKLALRPEAFAMLTDTAFATKVTSNIIPGQHVLGPYRFRVVSSKQFAP